MHPNTSWMVPPSPLFQAAWTPGTVTGGGPSRSRCLKTSSICLCSCTTSPGSCWCPRTVSAWHWHQSRSYNKTHTSGPAIPALATSWPVPSPARTSTWVPFAPEAPSSGSRWNRTSQWLSAPSAPTSNKKPPSKPCLCPISHTSKVRGSGVSP